MSSRNVEAGERLGPGRPDRLLLPRAINRVPGRTEEGVDDPSVSEGRDRALPAGGEDPSDGRGLRVVGVSEEGQPVGVEVGDAPAVMNHRPLRDPEMTVGGGTGNEDRLLDDVRETEIRPGALDGCLLLKAPDADQSLDVSADRRKGRRERNADERDAEPASVLAGEGVVGAFPVFEGKGVGDRTLPEVEQREKDRGRVDPAREGDGDVGLRDRVGDGREEEFSDVRDRLHMTVLAPDAPNVQGLLDAARRAVEGGFVDDLLDEYMLPTTLPSLWYFYANKIAARLSGLVGSVFSWHNDLTSALVERAEKVRP